MQNQLKLAFREFRFSNSEKILHITFMNLKFYIWICWVESNWNLAWFKLVNNPFSPKLTPDSHAVASNACGTKRLGSLNSGYVRNLYYEFGMKGSFLSIMKLYQIWLGLVQIIMIWGIPILFKAKAKFNLIGRSLVTFFEHSLQS